MLGCGWVHVCECVYVDNEDDTLVMLKWCSPGVLQRINEENGGRGWNNLEREEGAVRVGGRTGGCRVRGGGVSNRSRGDVLSVISMNPAGDRPSFFFLVTFSPVKCAGSCQ